MGNIEAYLNTEPTNGTKTHSNTEPNIATESRSEKFDRIAHESKPTVHESEPTNVLDNELSLFYVANREFFPAEPLRRAQLMKVAPVQMKKKQKKKRIYPCCGKSGGTSFYTCNNFCSGRECSTPYWHRECIEKPTISRDLWLCKNCKLLFE